MSIPFRCACGASFDLRDDQAGRILHCPRCGVPSRVAGEPVLQSLPPEAPSAAPRPDAAFNSGAPLTICSDMLAAPAARDITPGMLSSEPFPEPETDDQRRDFEQGMPLAPVLTLILITINIVVFAVSLSTGALQSKEAIIQAGALSRPHVLGHPPAPSPQPWRVVTAMFLHGGFDHLFGNAVALYILGMACEHAYGLRRLLLLYFLSGIGGSLLSMVFSPGPSVGASGAIFGLMGAGIIFFRKHGHQFILRDNRVGIVLIIWALYSIATGLLQPFVDNGAHVGGLIAGMLGAYLLRPQILDTLPMPPAETSVVPRLFGS